MSVSKICTVCVCVYLCRYIDICMGKVLEFPNLNDLGIGGFPCNHNHLGGIPSAEVATICHSLYVDDDVGSFWLFFRTHFILRV